MYTLMVADDHPLFRDALCAVIDAGLPGCQLLQADSLSAALQQAEGREDLDLLLLDLGLPDSEGLAGLTRLRATYPQLPVAIISAEQDRRIVLDAIGQGAVGYIPKSTPRAALLDALTHMLAGQVYLPPDIMRRPPTTPARRQPEAAISAHISSLTEKQREVLALMVRGHSNKRIARELDIAETTVKTHVSAILRKLSVTSRVQAIVAASDWTSPNG
ncbi:LuxR C-terminal-related transcriptional regulator [Halomonas chromatireducens]|uniref:Transcriptional regulatory protein DegU n=1 Tax=Halomonas chromatireducens TaxID=507626 RepID=A0A0X8HE01_9GAMM|nr:response regulator transcription factor [Halomonas chromatireducens]AMD00887.1 Transcriptional regulatory protein DegU [Halomonas chromatireducens]